MGIFKDVVKNFKDQVEEMKNQVKSNFSDAFGINQQEASPQASASQTVNGSFCHECGTRIEEGGRFCPSCGTAVSGAAPQQAASSDDNEYVEAAPPPVKSSPAPAEYQYIFFYFTSVPSYTDNKMPHL